MTLVHAEEGLAGLYSHPDVREIDRVDTPEQLLGEVIETNSCGAVFSQAGPTVTGRDQDTARDREFSRRNSRSVSAGPITREPSVSAAFRSCRGA